MQNISVTLSEIKKPKVEANKLGFGNYFTDHMFVMDFYQGKGWVDPRIVPYGPLSLDPSAMCLHYGQAVFEGLKAYRKPDGTPVLFRPEKNMQRLNLSCDRLCIPKIDEELVLSAIKELIKIDESWIPEGEGTSLYIRPFIIAVDSHVGVHPGHHLMLLVILSPVGAYYAEGINPVKIYVEQEFVRAVKGGMGYVKTAGNYASSLIAQDKAQKLGYTQVLWLDGVERKYIEEVGTMNVFFKIDGEIITPSLEGSILGGITRLSCIELLKNWGYKVTERKLALQEVIEASANGNLDEAFGTGTAAVISPIGELIYGDQHIVVNNGKIGETADKLYSTLTGIQNGKLPDPLGWVVPIR